MNPSFVRLTYLAPCLLPEIYNFDVWSTMMAMVVHAFKIKEMKIKEINKDNTSVFFILTNAFNNILESIEHSTRAILDESVIISERVQGVLKSLMIVVSSSLVLSICLIFPVATKVAKNKDVLLTHFMQIDREDVKRQLDKCREFFNNYTMHDKEHAAAQQ